MKALLESKDLWRFIEDTATTPVQRKEESEDAFEERLSKYRSKKAKAKSVIISNVSEEIVLDLECVANARDAWTFLQQKYQVEGMARRCAVFLDWVNHTFDGKDLEKFCSGYTRKLNAMDHVGLKVDEELRVYLFISKIDPFFETLAMSLREKMRDWKTTDDSLPFTVNQVISKILDEHEQKSHSLTLRSNLSKQKSSNKSTSDQRCTHCQSPTHSAEKCWHLHPSKAPKNWKPPKCMKQDCQIKNQESTNKEASQNQDNQPNFSLIASATAFSAKTAAPTWILDSGASTHMCNDASMVIGMQPADTEIQLGANTCRSKGIGNVNLIADTSHGQRHITLTGVLYVPDLVVNLLSMTLLMERGAFYNSRDNTLTDGHGTTVAEFSYMDRLPCMKLAQLDQSNNKALTSKELSTSTANVDLWHQRFGHAADVSSFQNAVTGMKIKGATEMAPCHTCKESTAQRIISRVSSLTPTNFKACEAWNVDVVTVNTTGRGRENYFVLFTDSVSSYRKVYFSPTKDAAAYFLQQHATYIQNRTGQKVKRLHVDGGREFSRSKEWAKDEGIQWIETTPHNSESNGRAEASNKTVTILARKLLLHSGLSKGFWPDAVETAVFILNRMPTRRLASKSPHQIIAEALHWTPLLPYVGNLRAFGSTALVLDQSIARGDKFSSRAKKGILVGFEADNICKIWIPAEHKVVRSTNVTFDETSIGITSVGGEPQSPEFGGESVAPLGGDTLGGDSDSDSDSHDADSQNADSMQQQMGELQTPVPELGAQQDVITPAVTRRSRRQMKESRAAKESREYLESQHQRLPPGAFYAFTAAPQKSQFNEPSTFKAAMKSPHADQWKSACEAELKSLEENQAWTLVDPPKEASVIKGRWVFKVKTNADGQPQKFKARWVAKGFTQKQGIDYDDTYASVVRPSSVKILLTIAATKNWTIKQFDIMTAFLNAKLDKPVYVQQPHGFEKDNKVCLLRRALYGLKQSPLLWFKAFSEYLDHLDFRPIEGDPCVFQHETGALLTVHVDDLAITAPEDQQIDEIAASLSQHFKMHSLGDIHYYLGCKIVRDRSQRKIWMLQDAYINSLAGKYNLQDCSLSEIPMDCSTTLFKAGEDYQASDNLKQRYQSLIGALMWPSVVTRIDIAYSVGILSRFLTNPTEEHLAAAYKVLRYLVHSASHGLEIDGTRPLQLEAYTDASYGGTEEDRRSVGGYLLTLCGSPITWKTGRQPIITTSSTEAEYVALSLTAKEVITTARFLQGFKTVDMQFPVTIHEDNQPSIKIALNENGSAKRTRHMDIRFHFIRQEVNAGKIKIEWIPTAKQAADGLTKSLPKVAFQKFTSLARLVDTDSSGPKTLSFRG